jgi:exopolysaccharide biosynthesis polyprenyl glycosylphosphotransferase
MGKPLNNGAARASSLAAWNGVVSGAPTQQRLEDARTGTLDGAAACGSLQAAPPPAAVRTRRRCEPVSSRLLDGQQSRFTVAAVDAFMLFAATGLLAHYHEGATSAAGWVALWTFPLLGTAMIALRGLNSRRLRLSIVDVVPRVCSALSLAAMLCLTAATAAGAGMQLLPAMSRIWVGSLVLVCAGRSGFMLMQRRGRLAGRAGSRALIVGGGVVGMRVARCLDEHPEYGLVPAGVLDADPMACDGAVTPVVGTPGEIPEAVVRTGAVHVILAFSTVPDHQLLPQLRWCEDAKIQVSLVPRLFESVGERLGVDRLGGLPLLTLRSVHPTSWQFRLKYAIDRCAAAVVLVVAAPLLLLCAAAVKLTSPGPVLFRQRRVGLDGRQFNLLKFRSMRLAPLDGFRFVPSEGLAPGGIEGVDRCTTVGRWLRRSCLDELPQLINVLRGEMSLVGPRPERPEFVELFGAAIAGYSDRHRVKSGITGWAQVHGLRGQTSLADRIEFDNAYIRNWSLGLDFKILFLTVAAIAADAGGGGLSISSPPPAATFGTASEAS